MSRLRHAGLRLRRSLLDRARVRYPVQVVPPEVLAGAAKPVVLGSAGDLGRSVVGSLLDAGVGTVWGVDRRPVDEAPEGLRQHRTDLTDPAQVDELVASLRHELGPPDPRRPVWLLGCSGTIGDHAQGLGAPAGVWHEVYASHVVGPAQLVVGLQPALGPGASITLVTSVNAQVASPWPHYATAKAAQEKLVEELAALLADDGVRVNGVAPARFRNQPDVRPGEAPLYALDVPIEAVAGALLFLADSARSPATSGVNLRIDGGLGVWHDRVTGVRG